MRNDFLNIVMQLLHVKAFQIPSYASKKCEMIAPCLSNFTIYIVYYLLFTVRDLS